MNILAKFVEYLYFDTTPLENVPVLDKNRNIHFVTFDCTWITSQMTFYVVYVLPKNEISRMRNNREY